MNILFLCHRIPYPPNKGDKIRSYHELRFLSRKHSIYLGTTLDQESDRKYLSNLRTYCNGIHAVCYNKRLRLIKSSFSNKPFSVGNFSDSSLQDYVNRILKEKRIDAVICFCSSMAEYIFNNPLYKRGKLAGVKLIMDFVDLDSDKWLQYARYGGRIRSMIYRLENRRLFKYEIRINNAFHHSIFVSPREVKVFKKLYPEARNTLVIPNGVDHEYFSYTEESSPAKAGLCLKGPVLVFTGFMDYFANEDGVKWFCRSIYPRIRAELPDAEFLIVGSSPTNMVWNLSEMDGVTVTGYVDDIRTYYDLADICVIPLRIARGLQNKVLEAMATGNAVVATSNASDGIICHNGKDIVIVDDEEGFAGEVVALTRDETRRREIGRRARENIVRNYSWDANMMAFEEILQS